MYKKQPIFSNGMQHANILKQRVSLSKGNKEHSYLNRSKRLYIKEIISTDIKRNGVA